MIERVNFTDEDDDSEPRWQKKIGVTQAEWDAETQACTFCKKSFSVMRRRHHCRGCGKNVCQACSKHKALLPTECGYGSDPQRICAQCHHGLQFEIVRVHNATML